MFRACLTQQQVTYNQSTENEYLKAFYAPKYRA